MSALETISAEVLNILYSARKLFQLKQGKSRPSLRHKSERSMQSGMGIHMFALLLES